MLDQAEDGQRRRSERGDEDNEEKDAESRLAESSNPRTTRKIESGQKTKKSRSNSRRNRRKSSRSRSRSRSRRPSDVSSNKSWKSANAWLNFMQDFREYLRGYPALRKANVFRLAGEQWSEMSPEQKKPYIDAANKIKRMKQQENDNNERRSKSKPRARGAKTDVAPKRGNQKKKKRDEEQDEKSDSESDSGTEVSTKTMESDNVSIDTDGSV